MELQDELLQVQFFQIVAVRHAVVEVLQCVNEMISQFGSCGWYELCVIFKFDADVGGNLARAIHEVVAGRITFLVAVTNNLTAYDTVSVWVFNLLSPWLKGVVESSSAQTESYAL